MIIAVDFDGTLYRNKQFNTQLSTQPSQGQRSGNTVVLWTCRECKTLKEAFTLCHQHGSYPTFVNCNCPERIMRMGRDSRKVFADVYIDDKNAR